MEQFGFLLAQPLKECFAVQGLDLTAVDLVIAAVQHVPDLLDFFEVPGDRILHQVVSGAATP